MWEVFSGGRVPYPAVDPLSLIQLLGEGRRLERPTTSACAAEMYVHACMCRYKSFYMYIWLIQACMYGSYTSMHVWLMHVCDIIIPV